jgi:hypothetical protein
MSPVITMAVLLVADSVHRIGAQRRDGEDRK